MLSHVRLCATPWTVAHQAPPSLGFSRQEHWSGLPFPSPMHESDKWKWSRSVVSDSSRPHGLQPSRLLRPWDFPGKSTGVGCHLLLRGSSWPRLKPTSPAAPALVGGLLPLSHLRGPLRVLKTHVLFPSLYWICSSISSVLCLIFWLWGMCNLSFPTRGWTSTLSIGRRSLTHWTAGKTYTCV